MPKKNSNGNKKTREPGSQPAAPAWMDYPLRRAGTGRAETRSPDLVLSGALVLLLYCLLEWSWHLVDPAVARAGKSIMLVWVGTLIFAVAFGGAFSLHVRLLRGAWPHVRARWINAIVFGAIAIGAWWGFWYDCGIAANFMPEPQAGWLQENGPWVPVFLLVLTSLVFIAVVIADLASQD